MSKISESPSLSPVLKQPNKNTTCLVCTLLVCGIIVALVTILAVLPNRNISLFNSLNTRHLMTTGTIASLLVLSVFAVKICSTVEEASIKEEPKLTTFRAQKTIKSGITRAQDRAIRPQSPFNDGLILKTEKNAPVRPAISTIENNFIQRLCNDPYAFYDEIQTARNSDTFISFTFFKLCPCKKLDTNMRLSLESNCIQLLSKRRDKKSSLTIVSVHARGAYQELVYITKLVKAGFQNIKLVLIEPDSFMFGSFISFFEKYLPELHLEIHKYEDLDSYVHDVTQKDLKELKPHLLLMLDLSESRYNMGETELSDYSFDLFKRQRILRDKTVIAYSILEAVAILETKELQVLPKAICCAYNKTGEKLSEIKAERKEFVGEKI